MKNLDYTLHSFVTERRGTDAHSFYLKVDPIRIHPVWAADTAFAELKRYRAISGIHGVQLPLIQSIPVAPGDPPAEDTTLIVYAIPAARVDVDTICRAAIRAAMRGPNAAQWRLPKVAPDYDLDYAAPPNDYVETCIASGSNVRHLWTLGIYRPSRYTDTIQRRLKAITDGGVFLHPDTLFPSMMIEVFAQPDAIIHQKAERAIRAAIMEVQYARS